MPTKGAIPDFVTKTFKYTLSDRSHSRPNLPCATNAPDLPGLADACPQSHSEHVDSITRVTGYFTKVSSWNKGKLGELKERYRNQKFFSEEKNREVVWNRRDRECSGQHSDEPRRYKEPRMGMVKMSIRTIARNALLQKSSGTTSKRHR